jgi:hypothetical protein
METSPLLARLGVSGAQRCHEMHCLLEAEARNDARRETDFALALVQTGVWGTELAMKVSYSGVRAKFGRDRNEFA